MFVEAVSQDDVTTNADVKTGVAMSPVSPNKQVTYENTEVGSPAAPVRPHRYVEVIQYAELDLVTRPPHYQNTQVPKDTDVTEKDDASNGAATYEDVASDDAVDATGATSSNYYNVSDSNISQRNAAAEEPTTYDDVIAMSNNELYEAGCD